MTTTKPDAPDAPDADAPDTDAPDTDAPDDVAYRQVRDIPPAGWWQITLRVKDSIADDNVALLAAGVAFFSMLALFPALAALISVWGLVADPAEVGRQLSDFSALMPREVMSLVREQLETIAATTDSQLSWSLAVSLVLSLWSATKGTRSLIVACNLAYGVEEARGWLRLNALSVLLTLSGVLFAALALGLLIVVPLWVSWLGPDDSRAVIAQTVRWPILYLGISISLAVLYRYAPYRDTPRWAWVSWGSASATIVWLLGSGVLSLYVANFGRFNQTYGAVGGVVITMLWIYLSAFVILLGAELNAEIETQARIEVPDPA